VESWRSHDNPVGLHGSLDHSTLHEFKQQHQHLPKRAVF
jgi:hypothetical protein